MENENISAFAFKTGRLIEDLINKETNSLRDHNQILEAKILNFYNDIHAEGDCFITSESLLRTYREHFNIDIKRHGKA